jgi:hypothetical protein
LPATKRDDIRTPKEEFSMNCRKALFRERAMNIDRDMGMGNCLFSHTRIGPPWAEKTLGPFIRSYVVEVEGNHG